VSLHLFSGLLTMTLLKAHRATIHSLGFRLGYKAHVPPHFLSNCISQAPRLRMPNFSLFLETNAHFQLAFECVDPQDISHTVFPLSLCCSLIHIWPPSHITSPWSRAGFWHPVSSLGLHSLLTYLWTWPSSPGQKVPRLEPPSQSSLDLWWWAWHLLYNADKYLRDVSLIQKPKSGSRTSLMKAKHDSPSLKKIFSSINNYLKLN
jgi:hypothetical protein